ncbi:hypothetical protein PY093_17635 [Cytobacillus sp. S13-E01]|nr:hypothetical protein [Cytobacillus sp. S13-E01]MDF0728463.1 hypothetical protein [Cytobacillus sp. S13-E01]
MKKLLVLVVGVVLTLGINLASDNFAGEAEHPDPTSYSPYTI